MNYILITPAKDEEENLPKLAECIVNQTILPLIWVILDDGSTDKTPTIIKELERNFFWIKGVTLEGSIMKDLDIHFGEICNQAFEEAMRYCEVMKIPVDYLAKVDSDIVIPRDCMQEVLYGLDENRKVGIAGPDVKDMPDTSLYRGKLDVAGTSEQKDVWYDLLEPSDGVRIYRMATFKDIGGIPETMAPDNVALAKAKLKGWQVKRFKGVIAFKTRKTAASIRSIRYGYKLQGLRRYYLDYPLSLIILLAALEVLKGRPGLGIAILSGFMSGFINKKGKIKDEELRIYYRKKRPKEIVGYILRQIGRWYE